MPLSLAQLTKPLSTDDWRARILLALQGLGVVSAGGRGGGSSQLGTGTLSLSGSPAQAYPKVIVTIVAAGELGTATFNYSLDGGITTSVNFTVPASPGIFILGSTGATITFAAGPAGAGVSFAASDTFAFALAVSPLAVTSWQAGGTYRTLTEILAQALADLSTLLAAIAAGGLTNTSTGAWLDLLASNVYQLTRNQATFAKGVIQLAVAIGSGPYTIPAGGIWVSDASGHRFNNSSPITLGAGPATVPNITVQAELAGSAYNLANGAITIIQAGTLPGVTVSNPDPGTGTWITTAGADAESDAALVSRCQARWPALSQSAGTAAVYDLWARSSEAAAGHGTTISRTLVQADPAVAGRVNVYLATATGPAGASAVTDANAYIQQRVALTTSATVQAAAAVVMTVAGTINFFSGKTTSAAAQAAVQAALQAYISALSLGIDAAGTVKAYWSEIDAAAGSVFGVRNIVLTLNGGTADVALTAGQVATLTLGSITYTPVSA